MTRLMPTTTLATVLVPLLVLGGCGTSSAPQAGSKASGEVLPGSVSDAMLDTNGSQARAPLAPIAHGAARKPGNEPGPESSSAATDANGDANPTTAEQAPQSPGPTASAKPATP